MNTIAVSQRSGLATSGYILAPAAIALFLLAPTAVKFDLLPVIAGVISIAVAAIIGLIATIVLIISLIKANHNNLGLSLLMLLLALTPTLIGAQQFSIASSVPNIHDISTDTVNPPEYVKAAQLRKAGENSVQYAGEEISKLQLQGYPEIKTLILKQDSADVFEKAKAAIQQQGLTLLAEDFATGRLEAVQTTFLFGFKDDVVIRLQDTEAGTLVDIRSMSRVGENDFGVNAKRISNLLSAIGNL